MRGGGGCIQTVLSACNRDVWRVLPVRHCLQPLVVLGFPKCWMCGQLAGLRPLCNKENSVVLHSARVGGERGVTWMQAYSASTCQIVETCIFLSADRLSEGGSHPAQRLPNHQALK